MSGCDIDHLEKDSEYYRSLQFSEFYRGRSALGVILVDEDKNHYPMALEDFENLLKNVRTVDHDDSGLTFFFKFRVHRHGGYTRIVPVL